MQMLLETKDQFWVAQDWSPDGRQSLLVVREVSINEGYPGHRGHGEPKQLEPLPLPGKRQGGGRADGLRRRRLIVPMSQPTPKANSWN